MKKNSKKNKKRFSRIIPALWGLACLLIFAGVLFAGLGNYHREIQEIRYRGSVPEAPSKAIWEPVMPMPGSRKIHRTGTKPRENRHSFSMKKNSRKIPRRKKPGRLRKQT